MQFEHPDFVAALRRVSDAAMTHGKAAGFLTMKPESVRAWKAMGYTFLAFGSDGGMVSQGMRTAVDVLRGS